MSAAVLTIAADHPALAGHFPGMPVVPGVVLLDEALHAIGAALGADLSACRIASVKFLSPVLPGQAVEVLHESGAGSIRFTLMHGERKVASGVIHRHAEGTAR
ncbi:MAG: acyl-coenzyme synthetase/AMP-(fatty) acid ligase-like protein [Burkholderia sp.]|nr:acyl-coenzyme synthetase/AMP-(fatty) acid ligase-like protein [Burkholderia sp.]